MKDSLTIQLLGGFQISNQAGPLSGFANTRLQSVLTYLVLARSTPQSRQQLAYLFWPDSTDKQARTNLRNSLHLLRTHLPDAERFVNIDTLTVQWRPDAPADIDVVTFDDDVTTAQRAQDPAAQEAALTRAIALYVGDLLPNCYDEWILSVREEWQQRYISACEQLIDLLDRRRDHRTALDHAQRLLQYDPLLETTYGRLMQLHAALGDRAAALRVYHLCRSTLDRELGVEPSPTTQAIYERLLNLDGPTTPVEALRTTTPLVGRATAWQALQQLWQSATQTVSPSRSGPAIANKQLVLVNGEAGIGKTRLVEELSEAVRRQGAATAMAYCYPAGGRLAYAPLQSWLRAPEIERHRHTLAPSWRHELARLLPELLDADAVPAEPSPITDAAHRRRLFEAVLHALTAGDAPLLLILDDIQWCDRDTLEWVEFLLHSRTRQPLLLVATLRSGETTPDDPLSTLRLTLERTELLVDIDLMRFTQAETIELVANLTGTQPDDEEALKLYEETAGVPLFVVETIRARHQQPAEQGTASDKPPLSSTVSAANALLLPAKIQSVIEGRLVRLSPDARALADLAAVVGRAFATRLLTQASTLGEDELVQGLDELWQQQIIHEHAGRLEETYTFVHDKLREVVYGLLSPMRRRQLHRRVAEALEALQTVSGDVSAQIASHYELAGQPLVAVEWHQRAAHAAHRLSALQDALGHLNRALELLQALRKEASTESVDALELAIQTRRGAISLATKGHAAPEVEQAMTRALELCTAVGTPQQRFAVLYGLGRYYLVKPDLDKGLAVAQQLLQFAEASQNADLLIEAYTTMGTYTLHRAALHETLDYLGRALALYDRKTHGNHTVLFGQDPGVVSLSYSAWAHWCLGETESAQTKTEEALQLADELGFPYNRAIAQTYAAAQFQYFNDAASCLPHAEAAAALASEQGFILWQAMADFMRGWSYTRLDAAEKGLSLMSASANLFRATGAELGACYFAALQAEALAQQDDLASATAAMADAFDLLERTHDQWCAAELHRIHGTLLLQQGKAAEAKDAFSAGLAIAQEQGAAWWEERCRRALEEVVS